MPLNAKEKKRIWTDAKNAAGPRYTEEVNVDLPIKEVFEGIAKTRNVFEEIKTLKKEFRKNLASVKRRDSESYGDRVIRKELGRNSRTRCGVRQGFE